MAQVPSKRSKAEEDEPFLGIDLSPLKTAKLHAVVNTMLDYEALASIDLNHQIESLSRLSKEMLDAFPELQQRPVKIRQAIHQNYKLVKLILGNSGRLKNEDSGYHYSAQRLLDLFVLISKEWSSKGQPSTFYYPALKSLLKKYALDKRIFVVGGYLGRLLYELSRQGYLVHANEEEFDYFLVCNYFLNLSSKPCNIYPFSHNFCNHHTEANAFSVFTVPNIPFWDLPPLEVSVSLGKFDEIYQYQSDSWSCMVVHFYLERSNPVKTIKRVHQCLKKGGVMICCTNLVFEANEIELGFQQVKEVCTLVGFDILEQQTVGAVSVHKQGMMEMLNQVFLLVARKK